MGLFCCFSGGGPAAHQPEYGPEPPHEEHSTQNPGEAIGAREAISSILSEREVPSRLSARDVPYGSLSRASITSQISQILSGVPAAGARSNDLWANLAKTADSIVGALAITAASFYIFTSSRRFCKVVPSSASPLNAALRKSGWELYHAGDTPSALQVTTSRKPSYFHVRGASSSPTVPPPPPGPAVHPRAVPADYQVLHHQAGCEAFLMLPLYQGPTVVGALLLAHTAPIPNLIEHRWLGAYLPLISLYLAETSALKLVNFTEKIQTAVGLNQLAWIISSDLDTWFDWCHPDDTEARLVLLAPDQSAAMVLSRSVGALRAFDPVNSIDVLVSGGIRSGPTFNTRRTSTNVEQDLGGISGIRRDPSFVSRGLGPGSNTGGGFGSSIGKMPPEEGLLGTHMSLSNTLTRRCLAEGSKLLFVADVMAALKKYGEPWKDVFMEQARVTNPTWVVAAPIAHGGKHLGAILWLSSSRLNPNMLAQTAKATVPLLLHTVARQMIHLIQQASSAAGAGVDDPGVFWSQLLAMPHLNMVSGATATGTGFANGTATGVGYTGNGLDTGEAPGYPLGASIGIGLSGSPGLPGAGGPAGQGDVLPGGGVLTGAPGDGSSSRQLRELRPTVLVRSDSVSTSALVRAYQTAIAQAQRAASTTNCSEVGSAYEEIQVIAKAGQGAFGSVYVALWKGLVVAVKVMRQQAEGRRAMRTAWELAVTKSVSHPNIVMVYATFTDVVVVKLSKRLIRFVPAATTLADPPLSGNSTGGGFGSGGGGGGGGGGGNSGGGGAAAAAADGQSSAQGTSSDAGARCQVIIMEYCNLGPLHHYVAERRYAQQLAQQQAVTAAAAAAAATAPPQGAGSGDAASAVAAAAAAADGDSWTPTSVSAGAPAAAAAAASGGGGGCSGVNGSSLAQSGSNSSSGCLPANAVTGPVEFSTTLATLLEVASALQYLHSLGFIHCDLKPENVLLKASPGDPRGFTIKVSDFGLSELLTSDGPLMGELGGTVTHIAPEIVTHKRVTKAADAYAFGVVMWEMLTGNRLYSDLFTSGREKRVRDKLILAKVAHEGLRPVFPEGTPQEYAVLARRCWAADPLMRPTFSEILTELEMIQRRYCRNVPPSLPGLGGLVGAAAAPPPPPPLPAAAAGTTAVMTAATAPVNGAAAVAGGGGGPTGAISPDSAAAAGGVGVGVGGGSNGVAAVPLGNTSPLPLGQRGAGPQPLVRAATDVGMAPSTSPRLPGSLPVGGSAAATPLGPVAAGRSEKAGVSSPGHIATTSQMQMQYPLPSYSGHGGNLGGSSGGGGGAIVPQLRAASTHSPLQPSPLRQMSTARGGGDGGNGNGSGPMFGPPPLPAAAGVAAAASTPNTITGSTAAAAATGAGGGDVVLGAIDTVADAVDVDVDVEVPVEVANGGA